MARRLALPESLERRFEALAVLGKGGGGRVLSVRDRASGAHVALKLIHTDSPVPSLEHRFRREVEALQSLDHPGILTIHDFGEADGQLYLVTELLDGKPLSAFPQGRDPLPPMLQAAEALEAVHAAGLIHRDVKPDNLLLTGEGRVVLLDFGIVRDPNRTRLTKTGMVVGTLAFMAPEALRGKPPSPAADWFGWGATLYWLVEREAPVTREAVDVITAGGNPPPVPLGRLRPPHPLHPLVQATLHPDPAQRASSLEAVRAWLPGAQHPPAPAASMALAPLGSAELTPPERARPRRSSVPAVLGALGLAGLALGLAWSGGSAPPPGHAPPEAAGTTAAPGALAGLEDDLDEDLARLSEAYLGPDGALGMAPPGAEPEGSVRLLSGAPRVVPALFRELRSLRRLSEYLGEGGDGSDLTPSRLSSLLGLDHRLLRLGLPRPFGVFLAPLRAPGAPSPPNLPGDLVALDGGSPRARALWGELLRLATELDLADHAVDEQVKARSFPPDLPMSARLVFGIHRLEGALFGTFTGAQERRAIARWFQDGSETLARFLFLASRLLRLPGVPATPARAHYLSQVLTKARQFLFGHATFFPPALLFPEAGATPASATLEGLALERMALVHGATGLDPTPLARRAEELLRRAFEELPTPPSPDRSAAARAMAGVGLVRVMGRFRPRDELQDFVAGHREWLQGADGWSVREAAILNLVDWWRAHEDPAVRRLARELVAAEAPTDLDASSHEALAAARRDLGVAAGGAPSEGRSDANR